MVDSPRTDYPALAVPCEIATFITLFLGAPAAIVVAATYGLPLHAVVSLVTLTLVAGFGVTVGFHRLFAHRSFATFRTAERVIMVCGCLSGQWSPFFWVATHRRHHRHSDHDDDPHSPHAGRARPLGRWGRFWYAHMWWTVRAAGYDPDAVRDMRQRPDFVWIDRYWYLWHWCGLLLPGAFGWAVGGTAYDALIGFLWGGLFRHALTQHTTYAVNSVCHLWGSRPHPTGDHSRNNLLVGLLALGEGWHNNHHAFPYSARHGLEWWQPDATWCLIWALERVGLVWRVRRAKLPPPPTHSTEPAAEPAKDHTAVSVQTAGRPTP